MPDWTSYVRQYLSLPNCPPEQEAEIIEELAQQLDDAYQDALNLGLSEREAQLAAKRHITDWPKLAHDLMQMGIRRTTTMSTANSKICIASTIETMRQDVRYAGRTLAKRPLLTIAIILTLAIGIGVNTAIFSVVNSVLLQPLPYPASSRLAVVWSTLGKEGRAPASGPELLSLRERSRLFDQFAGIWVQSGALTGKGEPEQVKLGWVTSNFLSLLNTRPQVGRFFLPQDEGSGRGLSVVLSHELWERRYAEDPKIIGKTIRLSGRSCTVVGVLPAGFKLFFPEGASVPPSIDIYAAFPWDLAKQPRDQEYIRIIGRLRNDVSVQQAQAELDSIATQLRSEFREYSEQSLHLLMLPLQEDVTRSVRPALLALFAGTGFVLLIACANVAMLLLSRANERRTEITVRAALGAGPGRIIRQLLTESVLLSSLGGAAGLIVSWAILKILWSAQPGGIARMAPTGLSLIVFAFNMAVSTFCGVLFGLSPVFEARKLNLASALREAVKSTAGDKRWSRPLLVGGEVALTFVLLTSSILLIRTFIALLHVDPGFKPNNVLTFQVSLPDTRYPNAESAIKFIREAQRRLQALPSVQSAGVVSHLPFDDNLPNWYDYYWREGAPKQEQNTLMADHRSVLSEFFDSMGVTFVAGRNFDVSDEVTKRKVVIIDDALAKRLWPGGNAIGKKLNVQNGEFQRDSAEVIGVVKHVQYHSLTNQVRPQLYLPYALAVRANMSFTVRTNSSPQHLVPLIRREIAKLDKDLPVANVRLMDDYLSEARRGARFVTILCGALGVIGFLLSCIGIFGVTSSAVAKRTREIGIRMALGAQQSDITLMILRGSMVPVILGGTAGFALSIGLMPLLSSLLYGVHAIDPAILASVLIFLCLTGLAASFLPIQQIIRGNPIAALRCE